MNFDPAFYFAAIPAVALIGLGKGGFVGVATLALPLLALVISPVQGAAILLPLMIVQDAVGVFAFRHDWDRMIVATLLPGAALGTLLGFLIARHVSVDGVMAVLGLVSILFAAHRLWVERYGAIAAPSDSPRWIGSLFGVASGFTSQIALAGGPPFQMWVMPRRLPPPRMAGTTAIYFAAINWMKIPAFFALGQFSSANLLISTILLPVAVLSTLGGVWLVRRIDPRRFSVAIYVLMAIVGARLVWTAVA